MADIINFSAEQLQDLTVKSGISESVLADAGLIPVDAATAESMFGRPYPGIVFPYYDLSGTLVGRRIKLDQPQGPEKMRYMQSKDTVLTAHFLLKSVPSLLNKKNLVYMVEGEKKGLSLASAIDHHGIQHQAVVALPGCWNFRDKEMTRLGGGLAEIPWEDREVVYVPDTDFFTNKKVYAAGVSFMRLLCEAGATVSLIDLRLDDDSMTKIGCDDYLVQLGFLAFLDRCKRPLATFSYRTPSVEDLQGDMNKVRELFSRRSILPKLERSLLLTQIKKVTGVDKIPLKRELEKKVKELEALEPADSIDSDNDIIRWADDEPITVLFTKVARSIRSLSNYQIFLERGTLALVLIEDNDAGDCATKKLMDGYQLSQFTSDLIDFQRGKWDREKKQFKSAGFEPLPRQLMDALLEKIDNYISIRHIRAFSFTPLLVGNDLIKERGYHPVAEVYYLGKHLEARSGMVYIGRLLSGFPFAERASLINALGCWISMCFCLDEFPGTHPLMFAQGDDSDLGKTTFCEVSSVIAFGKIPSTMVFSNDDEAGKEIATRILDGAMSILIDNVKRAGGMLSSQFLEKTLTCKYFEKRLLATNQLVRCPNNIQYMISANDIMLSRDLMARAVPLMFSDKRRHVIDPNFDPLAFAEEYRFEIIEELLGMIVRWQGQGCPRIPVKFPKYPKWASLINGILECSGFKGLMKNFGHVSDSLEPITATIIDYAVTEISESLQVPRISLKRTPKQLVDYLLGRAKLEVFDGASSDRAKAQLVQIRLNKLFNRTLIRNGVEGEKIYMKLKSEKNSSKVEGNQLFWFEEVQEVLESSEDFDFDDFTFDWMLGGATSPGGGESPGEQTVGEKPESPLFRLRDGISDICRADEIMAGEMGADGTSAPLNNLEGSKKFKNPEIDEKYNFLGDINANKEVEVPLPPPPPFNGGKKFHDDLENVFIRFNGTTSTFKAGSGRSIRPDIGFAKSCGEHLVNTLFAKSQRNILYDATPCLIEVLKSPYIKAKVGDLAPIFDCRLAKLILGEKHEPQGEVSMDELIATFNSLSQRLYDQGLVGVAGRAFSALPVVTQMTQRGLGFSRQLFQDLMKQAEEENAHTFNEGKQIEKLLSHYQRDQLMGGEFQQYGTRYGGITCGKIGLQSLAKNSLIRRCIVPRRDMTFVYLDVSASQLHILAQACCDPYLVDVCSLEADAFGRIATDLGLTKIPEGKRKGVAKSTVYSVLLGAGVGGLQAMIKDDHDLEVPVEYAKKLIEAFYKLCVGIKPFVKEIYQHYEEGRIRTLGGRRLYWDETPRETQVLAGFLQGSEADILEEALGMYGVGELSFYYPVIVNRDSILVEVPLKDKDIAAERIKGRFLEASGRFLVDVKPKVKVEICDHMP
jgi:hypothetical protein